MIGSYTPSDKPSLPKGLDIHFVLTAVELGVWEFDLKTNQFHGDERCRHLLGFAQENPISYDQLLQFIQPDDRTQMNQALQGALNPQSGGHYEVTFRTQGANDSLVRTVRLQGRLQLTPEDQTVQLVGVAQELAQQLPAHKPADRQPLALGNPPAALELFDTVPAMIFYLDAQQRYRSYNEGFRNWFGVSETEAIGQTVREFLGEVAYQKAEPHLAIAYGGQPERYELLAPSRMKVERWLSIVYIPHKNALGEVIGLVVHATDITTSKQTEQALRQSEARFRSLVEEAPVATCLFVGRNLVIDIANEPMITFFGQGRSILNQSIRDVLTDSEADQAAIALLDGVFSSGESYVRAGAPARLTLNGLPGTYYFDLSLKPLRNEDGDVYAVLETAVDVTGQEIARQVVEEREATLQSILDLAELGSYSIEVATGRMTKSSRVAQWYGLPEVTDVATSFSVIGEPDRERVSQVYTDAFQPGSTGFYQVEYTVVSATSGQSRVLRTNGQIKWDSAGQAVRVDGSVLDITGQRALQVALEEQVRQRTEELTRLNAALAISNEELAALNQKLAETNGLLSRSNDNLQTFAYIASHDLQEPLRKIQQFGDLLKTRYADGEEGVYLERMQSAASRMSTLIKDLLNYSRLAAQPDARTLVSLPTIVDQVLTTLEFTIQETGAQIRLGSLPTLRGDATQLGQLFQNLLANALKFRRADTIPVIEVRAQPVAATDLPAGINPSRVALQYYCIEVVDNGVGFDEKYLDRIFQVFQRLHGKNEFTGTGIGLAICEKVVANHGGAITARSQPGQGALFRVYLPV